MKIENVKTNVVPSITWNWLKSNNDIVTVDAQFSTAVPAISNEKNVQISEGCTINKILSADFGSGVFNKTNGKVKDLRNQDGTTNPKEDSSKIPDYTNHPLLQVLNQTVNNPQMITISKTFEEPLILTFDFDKPSAAAQIIYAKENTKGTIILIYKGNGPTSILQTKVYAESYANIHLIKAQLLDSGALHFDDTQVFCEENASVKFTQIELGASHVNSGLHVNLNGYQSSFDSKVAYLCQNDQILDMNHIVYHYGKKSECNMQVDGTLKDNAQKAYRGTIDLKKGCCGAKGHEMEETLLLSPKTVNKSLPVILCDEEDVEGEHGATIGRLSSDILFYMQSRGISEKEAEVLMSRAKIQAAVDLIPDEQVKEQIGTFLEKLI
ncbi:MAG: SufD family Fe-S cluster assembly protein [Treponema sp.]|nr:SufD family Fe-S cluster assembly protein [Treponema sp.]